MRPMRGPGAGFLGGAVGLAGVYGLVRFARGRRGGRLAGQVALVTGASRGLGLLLAHELAGAGVALVITARDEHELEHAREELVKAGAVVLAKRCDVANRDQVSALVGAAVERFGRIDILVNN